MKVKKVVLLLVAAMVASVAMVGAIAAPASASVVGNGAVKICMGPNYSGEVIFDDRGGLSSTIVTPNSCWRGELGGRFGTETIRFAGFWNTHPDTFTVYIAHVDLATTGIGVTLAGITTSPTLSVW
jgi:hypothetical protein